MSHNPEECADTPRHCVETRPPTAFITEESTSGNLYALYIM
mgnify:CR=1 FL=1